MQKICHINKIVSVRINERNESEAQSLIKNKQISVEWHQMGLNEFVSLKSVEFCFFFCFYWNNNGYNELIAMKAMKGRWFDKKISTKAAWIVKLC